MENFITVHDAAIQWNISERQVQNLCSSGRIPGVSRIGRNWIIPKNASKPSDARIISGKYLNWKKNNCDERTQK